MTTTLPLHAQVKESIIALSTNGTLRPGDKLPTQKELCAQFKTSHMTVRRALDELIKEGAIRSVRGKVLYVSNPTLATDSGSLLGFDEQIQRLGMTPSKRVLTAEIVSASTVVAKMLKVEVGVPL